MTRLARSDHCGKPDHDPKASRRGFVEVRGIFAANTSELLRSEHPTGQVHWDCLTEWVERENALDTEVPF